MPFVTIKALDGKNISAFEQAPQGAEGPAIIVVREPSESVASAEAYCAALAARGFHAVAPDLYAGLTGAPDTEAVLRDLFATLAYARQLPGAGGSKVGAIGRGFAGKLVCLLAGRSDMEAGIAIHPETPEKIIGELRDIRFPFYLCFEEGDAALPPAVASKVDLVVKRNQALTLHRRKTPSSTELDEDLVAFLGTCFPT